MFECDESKNHAYDWSDDGNKDRKKRMEFDCEKSSNEWYLIQK